ncbi:MAG: hypothetical protein HBSIN02_13800 [Bacteroidia bacterium]|nr:MAG: hypothetical protein HBSIN02_13800 [Bacteroidia bacterium]
MRCREAVKIIAENLGALDGRYFEAVRAHLQTCSNCSAYLDSLEKTVLLYRRILPPTINFLFDLHAARTAG